jgi:hypothetical protein
MGYTPASRIESGAKYLLSLLVQESPIRYSQFYDGLEETSGKLAEAIGLEEDLRNLFCAEHIIDLAVYELLEQGLVQTKQLNKKLVDGEPDYEISLTPAGKKAYAQNVKIKFWDAE